MTNSHAAIILRENAPLAPYTTLGIGGAARFLVEAVTEGQVIEALDFATGRRLPVFVLGGGSNVVVSDEGFPGLVIRIALHGVEQENGNLTAAAGEDWDAIVRRCVGQGLAGIECLSGIPGTIGGTPVQNVGAYGQDVSEVIASVRALDREKHRLVELSNEECGFAYRTSIFNTVCRDRYIVLSVRYELRPGGEPRIAYPDLNRRFANLPGTPGLDEVREAVLLIRRSKSMVITPDDPDARSAGSFFKNPIVPACRAAEVEEAARRCGVLINGEIMPQYPAPGGAVKLAAAWLIEHAGFAKGYARGRVGLSSKHTLALVNRGGATAQELLDLMWDIQIAVRDRFGVELAPEPVFVGFA